MFSCEAVHYGKGSILVFLEIFASNDKIFSLGGGGGAGGGGEVEGWVRGHSSMKIRDFSVFS